MLGELLVVVGYACVVACYAPQWWRVIRTKRTEDISFWFVVLAVAGLCLIQAGLMMASGPASLKVGNALALVNALILTGAVAWVRWGEKHGR